MQFAQRLFSLKGLTTQDQYCIIYIEGKQKRKNKQIKKFLKKFKKTIDKSIQKVYNKYRK